MVGCAGGRVIIANVTVLTGSGVVVTIRAPLLVQGSVTLAGESVVVVQQSGNDDGAAVVLVEGALDLTGTQITIEVAQRPGSSGTQVELFNATGGISGTPTITANSSQLSLGSCERVDAERQQTTNTLSVLLTVEQDRETDGCDGATGGGGGGGGALPPGAIVGIVMAVCCCCCLCVAVPLVIAALLALSSDRVRAKFRLLIPRDGGFNRTELPPVSGSLPDYYVNDEPTRFKSPQGFTVELSPQSEASLASSNPLALGPPSVMDGYY